MIGMFSILTGHSDQRRADGYLRRIALISADPHHESAGSLWLYQAAYRQAAEAAAHRWTSVPTGMWEDARGLLRTYRLALVVLLAVVAAGLVFIHTAPPVAIGDARWLTTGAAVCLVVMWAWTRWSDRTADDSDDCTCGGERDDR